MKALSGLSSTLKIMTLGVAIVLTSSAWAGSKGSLSLHHTTDVAGTRLASGNYTVQWEGNGDQVDLKIYQGKKEVASSTARLVELKSPVLYDSAVVTSHDDGSQSLFEIRFGRKKYALQLTGGGGSASAGGVSR